MKARVLLSLTFALSIAVIALTAHVIQLRRQVHHAEIYVQAGVKNWALACAFVSSNLRKYGDDPEASLALRDVARACIARSDYADASAEGAISQDFLAKDVNGLVRRIDHAVETNDYFLPVRDELTDRFPRGY